MRQLLNNYSNMTASEVVLSAIKTLDDALDGIAKKKWVNFWAVFIKLGAVQTFSKQILTSALKTSSMYYKDRGLFKNCCNIPLTQLIQKCCGRPNRVDVESLLAAAFLHSRGSG